LTSFVELMNNKNLEDINLRKNLIVSIPNLALSFDKLRKLNLGKNMISKIEFILEFKKLKRIEELYIEGNPVIFIKDAYKKFYNLPLKFKDQAQFQIFKNNSSSNSQNNNNNGLNNSVNQLKSSVSSKNTNGAINDNNSNIKHANSNSNFVSTSTNNIKGGKGQNFDEVKKAENSNVNTNSETSQTKTKSNQSTRNDSLSNSNLNYNNNRNNGGNNKNNDPDNLSEEEREKLLIKIENEWKVEFRYIINNGFNGYSIKKLKETKMQLCHAEIERERQLNLFGNAIEVLGYKEFYNMVHTIKFEFINFDIISQRQNIENIKKFVNLKSLVFKSNNMHGFYQIIKLENIKGIEYITIRKNEICNGEILKYFLVYRLQNIKYFNDSEITNKDVYMSKKIFEHFDQAISICENESQKAKMNKEDKENGSANINKKELNKKEVESTELKYNFFNYAKINLTTVLDELLDL